MKKARVIIKFFQSYWAEVRHCADLTVELWVELMMLAPKLAAELKEAGDGGEQQQ